MLQHTGAPPPISQSPCPPPRASQPTSHLTRDCYRNGCSWYISIGSANAQQTSNTSQVSVISLANSIQAYLTLSATRQVYAGAAPNPNQPSNTKLPAGIPPNTVPPQATSPVTPLSARTFGTWTALSSIVRLYGAYHISNPAVYEMVLWTYGIAFAHFASEWMVFGTARWGKGLAGPVVVSTVSLGWMVGQWGWYVK